MIELWGDWIKIDKGNNEAAAIETLTKNIRTNIKGIVDETSWVTVKHEEPQCLTYKYNKFITLICKIFKIKYFDLIDKVIIGVKVKTNIN